MKITPHDKGKKLGGKVHTSDVKCSTKIGTTKPTHVAPVSHTLAMKPVYVGARSTGLGLQDM